MKTKYITLVYPQDIVDNKTYERVFLPAGTKLELIRVTKGHEPERIVRYNDREFSAG